MVIADQMESGDQSIVRQQEKREKPSPCGDDVADIGLTFGQYEAREQERKEQRRARAAARRQQRDQLVSEERGATEELERREAGKIEQREAETLRASRALVYQADRRLQSRQRAKRGIDNGLGQTFAELKANEERKEARQAQRAVLEDKLGSQGWQCEGGWLVNWSSPEK
jgi:hypothetical protein